MDLMSPVNKDKTEASAVDGKSVFKIKSQAWACLGAYYVLPGEKSENKSVNISTQ